MNKLYAPYIENILPAAAGNIISIPYDNHQTIIDTDYSVMTLLIKDALNEENVVGILETTNIDKTNYIATFYLEDTFGAAILTLNIGRYYKVFLAYGSATSNTLGYYSSVGVLKYTAIPTVEFNLNNTFLATLKYKVPTSDSIEKLYSVQYYLYNTDDDNASPIEKSDEILINYQLLENSNEIISTYQFNYQFDLNINTYYAKVEYKTTNNYNGVTALIDQAFVYVETSRFSGFINWDYWENEIATDGYNFGLNQLYFVDNNYYTTPRIIISNLANGSKVYEILTTDTQIEIIPIANGGVQYNILEWQSAQLSDFNRFILVKKDCDSGICTILAQFNTFTDASIYYDVSLEQGAHYQYILFFGFRDSSLTYFSSSDIVQADFEDMFLYDSTHILRLRFDPKVSSFKTSIPMTKQDPLGGQYPLIFQNGSLAYKEFPISATLSYLTDSSMYFINGLNEKAYGGLKGKLQIAWGESDYRINTHEKLRLQNMKLLEIDKMNYVLYPYNYKVFWSEQNLLQYYDFVQNMNVTEDLVLTHMNEQDIAQLTAAKTKISDLNEQILQIDEITKPKQYYPTATLSTDNIYLERQYKLAVLDWLNNGEYKVFKSPTEGNYIVRLINTTLAPKDQLGRMIHTINTTAVEMMEYNNNNLLKYNLLLYTKQ